MEQSLIDQYAFAIFSRAKIIELEFQLFEVQGRLAKYGQKNDSTSVIIESQINAAKQAIEELKSKLEQFKKEKGIN